MPPFRLTLLLVLALVCGRSRGQQMAVLPEPPPSAEAIMERVARNQDHAEAERKHYVYVQHAKVTSRKGSTVMCEEVTDSRVTPLDSGSHVRLIKLAGRLRQGQTYMNYTTPLAPQAASQALVEHDQNSLTINIGDDDREMVESLRASLIQDSSHSHSKDGLDQRLFPLSTREQADETFRLLGRERMNGRDVFHIEFRPRDKSDFSWKGDAYIDAEAYQPVSVTTGMSRKVPFAVRTLLGTNVPGLGFSVTYAPQPDGVWFPVSFGTEFKVHVLFFFSREILIAAQNREFEKTHVSSKIVGGDTSVDTVSPILQVEPAGSNPR